MNAKVYIRAAVRDGVTSLRQNYYTPPFKVANITEDRRDPLLQLMLMCSSPGVLDGDDYALRLELGENSRMQLHTQSYQRLFDMKQGAVQSMEVRLEKGAAFFYLPHPAVPHAHSVYTCRNKIFLSEGSRLVWGEVLTCGRKLNGEVFAFSKYHSVTDVFMKERLVLRENLCLQPLVSGVQGIGRMEGYTHQASLLLVGHAGEGDEGRDERGRRWDARMVDGLSLEAQGGGMTGATGTGKVIGGNVQAGMEEMKERIHAYLSAQEGVLSGISMGPAGSLVVRMLGNKAEQLYGCLKEIAGSYHFSKPHLYAS